MSFLGRLHPLLVHFPIALVMMALALEAAAILTRDRRWRNVAVINLLAATPLAVLSAVAGWYLAQSVEPTPLVEWHRWTGTIAAGLMLAAAAAAYRRDASSAAAWVYRVALLVAAALVAGAGHLGGVLVWGEEFLHL
jgi:uncharacterized membrane protein